ncbi:MAG: hypothetical protein JNK61_12370 [Bacteroidia bacterium]|nr:hypothetical protein [Bacteroidia bacterium]HQV00409.1 hypothetical protein [Bacteroidia bacterium]
MIDKSLFDILFYLVSPCLVMATTYIMLQKFFEREQRMQLFELKKNTQQHTLPLRLQAYERMVLYVERMMFNNLINRLNQSDFTVRQLQFSMINNLRDEYEHNVAQQLYMSSEIWMLIKQTKEETIRIIISIAENIDAEAPSAQLAKGLFEYIINNDYIKHQQTLDALKAEARQIF